MAATPRYGLRHPIRSDRFAPHTDMTNLAADIETALTGIEALGLAAEPWTLTPPVLVWDDGTSTGLVLDETQPACRWRPHHVLAQYNLAAAFAADAPTGTGYERLTVIPPPGGLTADAFLIAAAYRQTAADGAFTPLPAAPHTAGGRLGLAVAGGPWLTGDRLIVSAEYIPAPAPEPEPEPESADE